MTLAVVILLITAAILAYSCRLVYRRGVHSRRVYSSFGRMSKDIEDLGDVIDLTSIIEETKPFSKKTSKVSVVNTVQLDDEFKNGFTENLLAWYRTNRRHMPWRGDPPENRPITAYGVWVSEVMAQQTRIETVIGYWSRWMDRFPDVATLAAATPDEVNQMWAGLGYYRRAQNLLKGAQYLAEKHNSTLPNTLEELLGIPGVGVYTAGAIGSIVYNLPIPAVDGNVYRVLGRVCTVQHELGSSMLSKVCNDVSTQLVRVCDGEAGVYTQAIMELGATVCKPTSPKCTDCPVRMHCKAYQENSVASYPIKSSKKTLVKDVNVYIHVVYTRQNPNGPSHTHTCTASSVSSKEENDVWYLLFKRSAKGLLANQWEFPSRSVYVAAPNPATSIAKGKKKTSSGYADGQSGGKEVCIDEGNVEIHEDAKVYGMEDLRTYISSHTLLAWSSPSNVTSISTTPILTPSLVHIFSHEKHSMYVSMEEVRVNQGVVVGAVEQEHIKTEKQDGDILVQQENEQEGNNEDANKDEDVEGDVDVGVTSSNKRVTRWLTGNELRAGGISTQCKKVLERIEEALRVHTEKKKRRGAEEISDEGDEKSGCEVGVEENHQIKGGNAFDIMRKASSNFKVVKKKKAN